MRLAMPERMPPQMWAFLASAAAVVGAFLCLIAGASRLAAVFVVIAVVGGVAARVWSRKSPAPMPHWMRWVLFLPRTYQTADRLIAVLQLQPGQRVLEIGPGVGVHALPVAAALVPGGALDVLDVQPAMLEDLMTRAKAAGVHNVQPRVGDARQLPYPDRTFDAAYLISVLGEVSEQTAALRELHRVLKRDGRLVVGEIVVDPDFISLGALRERLERAGFSFEGRNGPGFAYLASFRAV